MPTTERITQNNQAENQKAREYLKKYPNAVTGNVNFYQDDDKEMKNLKDALPLRNFSCVFAIPGKDEKLAKLIRNYNSKPWTSSLINDVNRIFDRINQLNGITFYWI